MAGGLGNDTYVVDNAGDVVTEAAAARHRHGASSVTHTLAANVENLTLTGAAAINGTGNAAGQPLPGNTAANTLNRWRWQRHALGEPATTLRARPPQPRSARRKSTR